MSRIYTKFRMSDTDSQNTNNDDVGGSSARLPSRPQRSQRIDYHLLNGGSDEEVEELYYKENQTRSTPGSNRINWFR